MNINSFKILYSFIKKDLLIALSYKLNFYLSFLLIILTTFFFYNFSKLFSGNDNEYLQEYSGNYFLFVIIGISIIDISTLVMRSVSNEIRSNQLNGNLELILLSKSNTIFLILCSSVYPLMIGVLRFTLYIAILNIFYDINISILGNLGIMILSILLTYVISTGISLLAGSYVIYFKKGDPINSIVLGMSSIFSGILYPVAVLPEWGKFLSLLIPITYPVELLRTVFITNDYSNFYNYLLVFLVYSILLFSMGYSVLKFSIKRAIKNGNIINY